MADSENHNVYLPGHKTEHISIHAWRTAENSSAYLLPTLQAMVKKKPDLKLLDCGCGPGSITASFAKYMPYGEIVATDLSTDIVQRAAEHAKAQGVSNMKCQQASIYDLPFPDNSFDVVHVQQVLTHLDEPLQAVKQMLRVCRPGGVLAMREVDFRAIIFYPELPGLESWRAMTAKVMAANGACTTIGLRLVDLAMKAGVPREKIQASMGSWCYSTPEERALAGMQFKSRLEDSATRKKALDIGAATEAEIDEMLEAWTEWIAAESGTLGIMNGEVLITK